MATFDKKRPQKKQVGDDDDDGKNVFATTLHGVCMYVCMYV